jgi:16S rRNA (guanine966-N2)-methyltransferase
VRIVGGKFRGRTIHAPQGQATRPTTDRVREAIFNRLEHGVAGLQLDGARVLTCLPEPAHWGWNPCHAGRATFCSSTIAKQRVA